MFQAIYPIGFIPKIFLPGGSNIHCGFLIYRPYLKFLDKDHNCLEYRYPIKKA